MRSLHSLVDTASRNLAHFRSRRYWVPSYSQEGEDITLQRWLDVGSGGFYVDVGAHHPARFSNTALLYSQGWSGINIDPLPGSMHAFRMARPRDVNLEVAVGVRGSLTYYMFTESALNTTVRDLARRYTSEGAVPAGQRQVKVVPLVSILEEFVPKGRSIDLLTLDTEGRDLDVLSSNDWSRYRPAWIVAETLDSSLLQLVESQEVQLLVDAGYEPVSKLRNSVIFRDSSRSPV